MRLAQLRDRSVAVWGTGPEGRAAVAAIAPHGPSRLLAVDDCADYLAVSWDGELAAEAPLAAGDHAFPALVTADVVVRSPEVPEEHPWLAELRSRGVAVTSGSALWMGDHAGRTIAVTGGESRSAVAALIGRLLAAAGRPGVSGGAGPLLDLPPAEQYVLELSALQCADLTDSPRVAVLMAAEGLNLAAHGPELIVINGADDRLVTETLHARDANGFAAIPAGGGDSRFRIEDDEVVYCSDEPLFPRGPHGLDICVALAVLDGLGLDVVKLKDELAAAA